MVFSGQNQAFKARFRGGPGPLPAVETCGGEKVFGFHPVSPFLSAESVGAEVKEEVPFHPLPFQLGFGRYGSIGFGTGSGPVSAGAAAGSGEEDGKDQDREVVSYHAESYAFLREPANQTGFLGDSGYYR